MGFLTKTSTSLLLVCVCVVHPASLSNKQNSPCLAVAPWGQALNSKECWKGIEMGGVALG